MRLAVVSDTLECSTKNFLVSKSVCDDCKGGLDGDGTTPVTNKSLAMRSLSLRRPRELVLSDTCLTHLNKLFVTLLYKKHVHQK